MNQQKSARIRAKAEECLRTREARRLLTVENWPALTKVERKKAIALDILASVLLGQYTPQHIYVRLNLTDLDDTQQAQDHLLNGLECRCCELGAAFLSLVKFTNKCTVAKVLDDFGEDNNARRRLGKVFSWQELADMESSYESKSYNNCSDAACWFRRKHDLNMPDTFGNTDDAETMLLINLSIVEHGEFDPAKAINLALKKRRGK